jgi:hypothetical protein
MYHFREFPAAGGLISYGIDSRITYRQIGVPVLQPTKFDWSSI